MKALALVLFLVLTGCGKGTESQAESSEPQESLMPKVLVIHGCWWDSSGWFSRTVCDLSLSDGSRRELFGLFEVGQEIEVLEEE